MAAVINIEPEIQSEFRRVSKLEIKDGRSYHPKYTVYKGMLDRCYNENHSAYKWYGAEGVRVCDSWLEPIEGFWRFAEWHEATIPAGYTMDKDDELKLYSPGTVKPSLQVEQVLRQRRIKAHNTSGTQGVRFHKTTRRWTCNMDVYTIKCFIGSYDSQREAEEVYNAIHNYRINSPEDKDGALELIEFYRSEREELVLSRKKASNWKCAIPSIRDPEDWKEHKDFPEYSVSDLGRVYSFKGMTLMNPSMCKKDNLLSLRLKSGSDNKKFQLSRLVAELFMSNPENKKMLSYKDGNTTNCSVSNLEWVTHKELIQKAIDKGTYYHFGENSPRAKLTDEDVRYIRANYKKGDKEFNAVKLAERFGVSSGTIYNALDKFITKDDREK